MLRTNFVMSFAAALSVACAVGFTLQPVEAREKTKAEILDELQIPPAVAHADEGGIDFCPFLQKIAETGKSGSFDALINRGKPVKDESPVAGRTFWSLVRFGDGACEINNAPPGPSHTCFATSAKDDPKIENLYEALVDAAPRCLATSVTRKVVDQSRKTTIKGVEFENYDDKVKRRSIFSFQPLYDMTISLEEKLVCKSMLDCRGVYGLRVSAIVLSTGEESAR